MNWNKEAAAAESTDAVIALANRYIEWLSPETFARFPVTCRPGVMGNAEDVHRWRRTLLAETCTVAGTPDLRLQDLTVFFLRASARLNALVERPPVPAARQRDLSSQPA